MRLWYLSHRRPAKAQASLRIRAVSPEPSLFAHIKYGSRRRVRPKYRHLASLDGCACVWRMSLQKTKSAKISWAGSTKKVILCLWFPEMCRRVKSFHEMFCCKVDCNTRNIPGKVPVYLLSSFLHKFCLTRSWNSKFCFRFLNVKLHLRFYTFYS